MNIEVRKERESAWLEISGSIDVYSASAVGEAIQSCIGEGARTITLDLHGVKAIDSSGLGTLVGNAKTLASKGGVIQLVGLKPRILRMLEITGLGKYFKILESGMETEVCAGTAIEDADGGN